MDLEEALANPSAATRLSHDFADGPLDARVAALTAVTELQLREVPPDVVLPEQLLALPIRHLGMSGKDDKLVVPELVRRMQLERLDVWDLDAADLPPLPGLRHLEIVVTDPAREIAILAERFSRLVHLSVWGHHLDRGEVPDDIERFGMLETLELVSCGVADLPAAVAKLPALRELVLRGCPIKKVPAVLFDMPRLAALEVGGELPGLPPELARMTGLRRLELGFALNKGAMVSSYDDTAKLKALPRVLGELTNLERLGLGSCGVTEIDVLRSLVNLRSLDLSWAGMTTLEPLAALTRLEELDLDNCGKVRDFSPLGKLAKLRVLKLDGTEPRSLEFLRELRALKELHIQGVETTGLEAIYTLDVELHADDQIEERYAARAALRGLPTLAELEHQLGARDPAAVETALGQLAAYAEAASTRKANALLAWGIPVEDHDEDDDDDDDDDDEDEEDEEDDDDDDDDDAEGDEDGVVHAGPYLPVLDLALDRHLAAVSPGVLAKLFGALFRDTGDNFHAARRIAFELVSRDDPGIDDAQCTLVDGFIAANEYYETGHGALVQRPDTVHTALLERVFPLLRGPALVKLLTWASHGHLDEDHGDSMLPLFVPALERADAAGRTALLARLQSFVEHAIQYRNGTRIADRVWTLLAPVATGALGDAIANIRAHLDTKLAAARAREQLAARLSDAEHCAAAIAEAATVSDPDLEELQGALWRANEIELPRAAFRQLLLLWQRRERDDGIAGAIATAARTTGVDELRDDLSVLAADRATRGTILRSAVLDALAAADYPAAAIDRLRVLATEHDGLPREVADSRELRAVLFGAAHDWEQDGFERGVAMLETMPRYVPPPEKPVDDDDDEDEDEGDTKGSPSSFASMVANLAEGSELALLGRVARQLAKLQLRGKPLERVLAQLVAVSIVGDDPGAYDAIAPLIPREVTWDILAYNLACKAAKDGDRPRTLFYAARALELGKSPDQFLEDSDFEELHEDREFVALLDQHR